jgi:phosphate transport system permease protein
VESSALSVGAGALHGRRRGRFDRLGDRGLYVITAAAAVLSAVILGGIGYKVIDGASEAISQFGLGFITTNNWDPVHNQFGAASFIYGTAVSSFGALLMAGPLSIAIALFLTELAPRRTRTPIGTLVELLAALPSVVVGLWGILVLGPFLTKHLEPLLNSVLGWIPLFGGDASPVGLFPAMIVLTIMTIPIVASLTRDIFLTVPPEAKEGALALGATRWEMIKTTVLPYSRPGIIAAVILGLGRAIGEAIAVTQVIGGALGIHANLFVPSDTLASRIASQAQGAPTTLNTSSVFYLGVILLAISIIFNAIARIIVRNFRIRAERGT